MSVCIGQEKEQKLKGPSCPLQTIESTREGKASMKKKKKKKKDSQAVRPNQRQRGVP